MKLSAHSMRRVLSNQMRDAGLGIRKHPKRGKELRYLDWLVPNPQQKCW